MDFGVTMVKISAVYLLLGVVLGIGMGISGDFSLMSVHSHTLLLGWAAMSVSGLVYILVPGCNQSRLAKWHFWGHNLGLPVMAVGLTLLAFGVKQAEKVVATASMVLLLSLSLFAVNLFLHVKPERT